MLGEYFTTEKDKPTVVSVGSGNGFHEKKLEDIGLTVHCYDKLYIGDKSSNNKCTNVYYAKFPDDNNNVIPADCSNVILFAAFPEGYLGNLLRLYKKNGGNKLVAVVEGCLTNDTHLDSEPDYNSRSVERSCLLLKELESLKSSGMTVLKIGEAIEPGRSPTNIVFYGSWRHEELSLSKVTSHESEPPRQSLSCNPS